MHVLTCVMMAQDGGEPTTYINYAPNTGNGGWVAAVNHRSPQEFRQLALALFLYISQPALAWDMVTNTTGGCRSWVLTA